MDCLTLGDEGNACVHSRTQWHVTEKKQRRQHSCYSLRSRIVVAFIKDMPGSNLDRDFGYPHWRFFVIFLRRSSQVTRLITRLSSMKGSWREGSFTGDPEGYAK